MTDGMEQRCAPGLSEPAADTTDRTGRDSPAPGGRVGPSRRRGTATPGPMPATNGVVPPWGRPSVDASPPRNHSPALSAQLLRAVAQEILPRLRQAHPRPQPLSPPDRTTGIATGEIQRLTHLSMGEHGEAASAYVEAIHRQGAGLETLCLGLLSPAARELGELWVRDECSFVDVTLGLVRLQQALALACRREECPLPEMPRRRVLLLPACGEQHTFGLSMVAEFFRRDGWEVVDGTALSGRELEACVHRQWFDAVGFSLGSERNLERLTSDIRGARQASRNHVTVFLVGGPVFQEHPEYARQVGADGTADSASDAPLQARHLAGLASGSR